MAKQYKTTGEVRKMFTRIGRVGGNTVKGLVAGGRLFQVLWQNNLVDEKSIRQAADEAGISPEEMEAAFKAADNARKDLDISESEDQEPRHSKRKAA